MNNQLQVFKNEEFGQVRTILIKGEPWFVGKDIADVLGISNARSSLALLDEDEKGVHSIDTLGGNQDLTIINESGLYSLVLKSRKPEAKKFKKWVTNEVLPSIRKHGAYMTEDTLEKALTSPDFLIQLATKLKEEQEARKLAEQKVKVREKLLEENKDNIEMAKRLTDTNNAYDCGVLAKTLGIKCLGRNNFYNYLRNKKILMKNNVPYQAYMERDYFKVIAIDNEYQDSKTLVKINGVKYIIKQLIKDEYLDEEFNVVRLLEELDKNL